MYRIVVHRRAVRYLQNLPAPVKHRVKGALAQLAADPLAYPGVKAMLGKWAGYSRIRLGDMRVIFWTDQNDKTIYVDHIGPRGDVYR